MHEHEAAALGIPLVYRLIDFGSLEFSESQLDCVVNSLQTVGFDGINVTHPFKQQVMPLLDSVSTDAQALGAVNTVLFRDGSSLGFNTDWTGYLASLRQGLPGVRMHDVAQVGAGGGGSAIAYALLSAGVERLRVFDPDQEKAEAMAARIAAHFPGQEVRAIASAREAINAADGIVQTSPIGMLSHPGIPFDVDYIRPQMWVSDIVYFPIETELLRAARKLGCPTLGGGSMAVHQAAAAFRIITGAEPSVDRMLANFKANNAI